MINCDKCNAECCREICVEMDKPETIEDWDLIRWMVAHEKVAVYLDDEDDWLVEIKTDCKYINPDRTCKIYNERPLICKEHKLDSCVKNAEGGEKLRFNTVEEVDKYIEEVIKPKLDREIAKQRTLFDNWNLPK